MSDGIFFGLSSLQFYYYHLTLRILCSYIKAETVDALLLATICYYQAFFKLRCVRPQGALEIAFETEFEVGSALYLLADYRSFLLIRAHRGVCLHGSRSTWVYSDASRNLAGILHA